MKAAALPAAAVPAVLAASLAGREPAHAAASASAAIAARDQIACPRGFVFIYPDINFKGQPYVTRAADGSVRHLPDYIRGNGSSMREVSSSGRVLASDHGDNYP
ncbi:peptidase inhibitor family I36 protein [Streptomyces collinus]|uniref:peptidase inhibitor family I36 protein n=1 Tax=Streptomyces collinus TaxID=42684 RepID=UPI0036D1A240